MALLDEPWKNGLEKEQKLTGWVLIKDYNKVCCKEKRVPNMPLAGLDWLLRRQFQYSREACAWLDKQQFLEEIENIYNRSQEVLQDYAFCKDHLKNPMIVRLNKFEPDEYVWYFIRDEVTLFFLQLCDFG